MEFDELVANYIGPFGRFQALCFVGYLFCALPYFVAVQELVFQGTIPKHYCNDEYPGNFLKTKWNLTQKEVMKITAPPVELDNRKQCHVVIRDWQQFGWEDIKELLSGENEGRNVALTCGNETLSNCVKQVYKDEEFGSTVAERVNTYLLSCTYSRTILNNMLYLYSPDVGVLCIRFEPQLG